MKVKKSSLGWKSLVFVGITSYLAAYYDVGSFIISQDRGLWEQAGWKSYENEHVRRVKFLLWLGANPEYVLDKHPNTSVLENAVEWRNIEIVRIVLPLVSSETKAKSMEYACRRGTIETIEIFIDSGITPTNRLSPGERNESIPGICSAS